ncbi:MAG: hypothetical protein FJX31_10360, partial [Alphaproteobacteria bacterium]|nr:hypothetical protein [Alphaproteobacteria bacterium]
MKNNKIVFVGGHNLGCACLEYLVREGYQVALVVARADDTGEDGVFPSLEKRARQFGLPVVKGATANAPEVVAAIQRTDPAIGLSIVNNMILGARWFELLEPRLGIVNVHYAPLPRYAGYWPEMWAIWNGETEFGVTLHYAAPKVDAGDIIAQRAVAIVPDETRASLYRKNDAAALSLIRENLDRLLAGRLLGTPQD